MIRESKELTNETEKLKNTLKRINDDFPKTVQSMLASTERGLSFQTRQFQMAFKFDKWLNPMFNQFKLMQREQSNALRDEIEELDKQISSLSVAGEEGEERRTLEYLRSIKRTEKAQVDSLNTTQVMARNNSHYFFNEALKAGKKILSDLYSFAKQQITGAINNYNATMQQTYTLIQSYNNYTVQQYDALFKRLRSSISEAGMSSIIDINDLQRSYAGNISGGLFGSAAERNAYYEQIAKQAGVTFDWQDTNWMKTVSRFNSSGINLDNFMQQIITTTENITEAAGNGFAFTNGQINTMVENLNRLQSTLNLTDSAYIAAYRSFGTAGAMLNQYGIDASKIYADITEYASSGITSSSTAKILNLGGETQASLREKMSSGRTDDIVLKYLSELQSRYDKTTGEFVNVASSALGESLSSEEILAYQNYIKTLSEKGTTVEEEYKRIYNYNEWAYDNMVESLSNTETAMDKITNWMDNYFAELGKLVNQHPILSMIGSSLLGSAGGALSGWFSSGLGKETIKTLLQNGGITNPFKNILVGGANNRAVTELMSETGLSRPEVLQQLGMQTPGQAVGSMLKSSFTNGTAFASGGKIASGLGKTIFSSGATTLGLLGGIGWAGSDLISGFSEGGIEGGFKKMFTGSAGEATSAGDVALGTLSGAGKGALLGMKAGPYGALGGAAFGAMMSFAMTMSDLTDTVKVSNRAIKNNNEMYQETQKVLTEFTENQKRLTNIQAEAEKITIGAIPPDEILNAYPELNIALGKNNEATQAYVDLLNQLIEAEKKENADKLLGSAYTGFSDSGWKSVTDAFANVDKKKATIDLAQSIIQNPENYKSIGYDASTGQVVLEDKAGKVQNLNPVALSSAGIEWIDLQKIIENKPDKSGAIERIGTAYSNYQTEYSNAEQSALKYIRAFSDPISTWFSNYGISLSELGGDTTEAYNKFQKATGGRWDANIAKTVVQYNEALTRLKGSEQYRETIEGFINDGTIIKPSQLINFLNAASTFDKGGSVIADVVPAYAVGTIGDSTIPYDTLAYLHKGEQIRTAAEVSIAKAEHHVASSDAIGALNSSVLKQTDTIISLLTQILQVTTSLSGRLSIRPSQTYNYSATGI